MGVSEKNGNAQSAKTGAEAQRSAVTDTRAAYLETCMEQIRCKRMRPVLAEELEVHIEDQKESYLAKGFSEAEAEELSVQQMGDPVETGIAFDRVHRPRMDWYAIGMIAAAALAGLILYAVLYKEGIVGETLFYNFLTGTLIGLPVMAAVCFLDYTILGKHPVALWLGGVLATAVITFLTPTINGRAHVGWVTMLLMPLFAGVVYRYCRQRYFGIFKTLVLFGSSVLVLMAFGALDTASMRMVFICGCLGMLLVAIAGGWYQVPRKTALFLGGLLLAGGAAVWGYSFVYGSFRRQRILAWLNTEEYADGTGYLAVQMSTVRNQLKWTGHGSAGVEWMQQLILEQENYLFLGMMQCFGIIAGIAVVLLLAAFSLALLNKVLGIKNRLGCLVGIACWLTIVIPLLLHVAINLGWLPVTDCWMPFFSGGGKSCVAFYAVLGLMLSVFRNKDCAPETAANGQLDSGLKNALAIRLPGGKLVCQWVRK